MLLVKRGIYVKCAHVTERPMNTLDVLKETVNGGRPMEKWLYGFDQVINVPGTNSPLRHNKQASVNVKLCGKPDSRSNTMIRSYIQKLLTNA